MSYFYRTAIAFRNQVAEQTVFDGEVPRLGLVPGMLYNGAAFPVMKTPDKDRWEQTETGSVLHKEAYIDVLRDDFAFLDGTVWKGIRQCGLYGLLTSKGSTNKRPEIKIIEVTYQIFEMPNDDANDACVKLLARRKQ